MKKKLLWVMALLPVLIAGVAAISLTFVLTTERGLHWLTAQLSDNIPGKLTYDSLHGHLADEISIRNLRYETGSATYSIDELIITLRLIDLLHGSLHINTINGSGIKYIQHPAPAGPSDNAQTKAAGNHTPNLPVSITLDKGVLRDISILIEVEDAQASATQQPFLITAIGADSVSLNKTLSFNELRIDTTEHSVSIKGTIGLSSTFPVNLQTSWRTAIPGYTTVTGNGSVTGDRQKIELTQSVETPFRAQLHGAISEPFKISQQHVQLAGNWQHFDWPSGASPTITSRDGDFQIEGNIDQYKFTINPFLENIPQLPAGKWSVSGNGGRNKISFTDIDSAVFAGTIHGQGELSWQPRLAWQFKIQGHDLNPAKQWPEWPGRISLTGTVEGGLKDKKLFTAVKLDKASGKIRDYPLVVQGQLEWTPDSTSISSLKISSDNNALLADGTLTDRWDFEWEINAPEINALLPDIHGMMLGKGKIIGPKKTPHLTLAGQGKQLAYDTRTAESLDISADIDLLSTQPSIINLVARDIHIGQQRIEELELQAVGKIDDHKLLATLNTRHTTLILGADAAWQDKQWAGIVSTADITSSRNGEWKLDKPFQYSIKSSALSIDKGCWQNPPALLCLEGRWQQNTGGHVTLSANKLPLTIAGRFLPPGLDVDGTFDTLGNFNIDIAGNVLGSMQLETGKGHLSRRLASGAEIAIEYHDASVTAQLDKDKIVTDAFLNINKDNFIKGTLSLPQTALNIVTLTSFDNVPVKGQLNVMLNDLELLPYFVPELENTKGIIKIDLTLSGTTSHPQLKALAQLENASAEIPRAGLHLTDIQLSISGNAIDKLKLTSQAQSGKGTLAINGTFGWDSEDRIKAQLAITGKQFEIVKIPEIWITASPDLTIDVMHRRVDINGEMHIPEALIEPRDLASTQRPSSDITIANGEEIIALQRWQIYSLVNFILGEQVKFDGFGLTGNIDGNVALIDTPDQITTAYGQLRINKGIYRAYGQKLTVDKGRLLFVGGPADNPGLDINATRQVETVTAGVNIRGTLQSPRLHIFSVPTMAESDALSYLVLGRPMNQASQSEGEVLFGAATSISLAGSELLAKQVGTAFQVDEIRIESGNTVDESTLVVGKYLSSRLYVSYGIGLIEPINTFILRYKLGSKWSLQSETGLHTGADLFYTLEK